MFDRFASCVADGAGKAYAFVAAVLLVALWIPTFFLIGSIDTWQLIINTATTIITFLMVFLIQHTQNQDTLEIKVMLQCIIDHLGLGEQKDAQLDEEADQ